MDNVILQDLSIYDAEDESSDTTGIENQLLALRTLLRATCNQLQEPTCYFLPKRIFKAFCEGLRESGQEILGNGRDVFGDMLHDFSELLTSLMQFAIRKKYSPEKELLQLSLSAIFTGLCR